MRASLIIIFVALFNALNAQVNFNEKLLFNSSHYFVEEDTGYFHLASNEKFILHDIVFTKDSIVWSTVYLNPDVEKIVDKSNVKTLKVKMDAISNQVRIFYCEDDEGNTFLFYYWFEMNTVLIKENSTSGFNYLSIFTLKGKSYNEE